MRKRNNKWLTEPRGAATGGEEVIQTFDAADRLIRREVVTFKKRQKCRGRRMVQDCKMNNSFGNNPVKYFPMDGALALSDEFVESEPEIDTRPPRRSPVEIIPFPTQIDSPILGGTIITKKYHGSGKVVEQTTRSPSGAVRRETWDRAGGEALTRMTNPEGSRQLGRGDVD